MDKSMLFYTEGGEEGLACSSSCRERHVCAKLCFNWFGTEMGCCVVSETAQNFCDIALAALQTPSRLVFDNFARSSSSINAVSRPSVLTQM